MSIELTNVGSTIQKVPEFDKDAILLDQREGIQRLASFLLSNGNFDDVKPFTFSMTSETRTGPYLGKLGRRSYYIFPNIPQKLKGRGAGNFLVIPGKETDKGNQPYYWIDFFEQDDISQDKPSYPTVSCRLYPNLTGDEKERITDSRNWHSFGEQLLVDFINGTNGIEFKHLIPFVVPIKIDKQLINYRLQGIPSLGVHIEDEQIFTGDEVLFLPKESINRRYQWVDIVKIIPEIDISETPLLASYRILSNEQRLVTKGWKGPEKQALIDYLFNQGVSFDDLQPINIKVLEEDEISIDQVSGREIIFYFPKGSLNIGEQAVLVPKQDGNKLYQWLDLYRFDSELKQIVGEPVASGRLIDGGINQRNWLGYPLQVLKDYSQKKVDYRYLQPIEFQIGKSLDYINLWRSEGKKVYLVLSREFNINEGDKVRLKPEGNEVDGPTFILTKGEKKLGRYILDFESGRFSLTDNLVVNEDRILVYDKDRNIFTDDHGREYVTQTDAALLLKTSYVVLSNLLSPLTPIRYKTPGKDKPLMLYSVDELLAQASENQITDLDKWTTTSFGEYSNRTIKVYRDDEGDWTTKTEIKICFGLSSEVKLAKYLEKMRYKVGRVVSGHLTKLFSVEDLELLSQTDQYLNERLRLPLVNEGGTLDKDGGTWVGTKWISENFNIPRSTLRWTNVLQNISKTEGLFRGKRTNLYNLEELKVLPEFTDYILHRENKARKSKIISPERARQIIDSFFEEENE